MDWQVGDLALCIKSGRRTCEGVVYTVNHVSLPGDEYLGFWNRGAIPLLRFEEIPHNPGCGASAARFRKIRPDEQSGERDDWELLLDSVTRKVSA